MSDFSGKKLYSFQLSGPIQVGDENRFRQTLDGLSIQGKPTDTARAVVFMNSNGGNWAAGVGLAKLFSARGVATFVGKGQSCFSVCAMAFLGGRFEGVMGPAYPDTSRNIEAGAKLGFHAPYLRVRAANYSSSDIETAWAAAVQAINALLSPGDTFRLRKQEIFEILNKGPNELRTIDTVEDLRKFNIGLVGVTDGMKLGSFGKAGARNLCFNTLEESGTAESDGPWNFYTGSNRDQAVGVFQAKSTAFSPMETHALKDVFRYLV